MNWGGPVTISMRWARVGTALLLATLFSGCGNAYANDGGGLGGGDQIAAQHGLRLVSADQLSGRLPRAYGLIEQALPQAAYVSDAPGEVAGSMGGSDDLEVLWQPNGLRDTLLPPGATGERIYAVVVVLTPFLSGSDPLAKISLMTKVEAAAWNSRGVLDPNSIVPAPSIVTRIYSLPRATGADLIALFYTQDRASPTT